MKGLTSVSKNLVGDIIDRLFDEMTLNLLGRIPELQNKKFIAFSPEPQMTLAHLFIEAMGNKMPLPKEQEVLKSLLSTAKEYLDTVRSRTKARVTSAVDGYIMEERIKGNAPSEAEIQKRVLGELNTAEKALSMIAEAEAQKARSMGHLMDIGRIGDSMGQKDPLVFFVVVRDSVTCEECIRLHLLPDKITPRVWKLSELKMSYHKKGEEFPSVTGLHPHCRCSLSYLHPNYGFKDGKVTFVSRAHNELEKQRG